VNLVIVDHARRYWSVLRYVRLFNLAVATTLIVIGVVILFVASFANAGAVGGVVAGTGAGALLTELTTIKERAILSAGAERLRVTLDRMEAAAIFAHFRAAAQLGAFATQCLFGSELPSPDAAARFQELGDTLDIGFATLIPARSEDREGKGYVRYKQIKQALTDRHGESVAAAFAFVYAGGIVTGGSGTVVPGLAERLRDTLFDLPDDWLKTYVGRILHRWEQGDMSTDELDQHLQNVYRWLQNYGSRRPEVVAIEDNIRADLSRG
jgi:hypothetical protein